MATMAVTEILQWGEAHLYPGLVLGQGQENLLRRGELAWRHLRHASPERLAQVTERIERWNALEQKAVSV